MSACTVTILPLEQWMRQVSPRLRPGPHPIFDGTPDRADIELALALIAALDEESQERYAVSVDRLRAQLRT